METYISHMLHSCDQWFISLLNIPSEKVLSREQLLAYLEDVKVKIMAYIDSLTDEMLYGHRMATYRTD